MLSVETAVLNRPGLYLIAFVYLVPIATEKVSSIRSNTICCISVYLESVEEYSEGKIQLLCLNMHYKSM